jgi:hypothetical protein
MSLWFLNLLRRIRARLVFCIATPALVVPFLVAMLAGFVFPRFSRWVAGRGHLIR